MITIAKLKTLKDRTCVRKCALLFHQQAQLAKLGNPVDVPYIKALVSLFAEPQFAKVLEEGQVRRLSLLAGNLDFSNLAALVFALEDIHYHLLSALGSESSDWDSIDDTGSLDSTSRIVFPRYLVLDRLRSPFNIGSVFRSADSFGIEKIYLVEGCAQVDHPRCLKTARGCTSTVDHEVLSVESMCAMLEETPSAVFALETGGTDILEFPFPREGFAILGSEELGVSPELLTICDRKMGRVSLTLGGSKGSLNVSVATGIMLHRWFTT